MTNTWRQISVDDYGWRAHLRLVQDDIAVDISGYTTRVFIFTKPDGTEVTKTATFLTDGTDGWLTYTVESGLMDTVGGWKVRAEVSTVGVVDLTSYALRFSVRARG